MKRRSVLGGPETGLPDDPRWYQDAVFYEVRVRSFVDSNGDGIGDLPDLTGKLDYLQDLGVTAVWLLPFYPSPLRDDGYDISDYKDVHPEAGTLADVVALLDEAHRRGLRVITELVLNHTSDQHPWFQRARRAPPGSPERDFFVWSDTPERYRDARIIFKDFEPSNWSWDPVAHAYYWHRFFAHQPDLNFENPAVQEALLDVVDFWFGLGVDGLRLDAVPYLFEQEGTNCENLPATHGFLKRLRAHIDARFRNRMLLAEANQWPEDAAAYFGQGDECHMNFHFPIMPRMFMALRMEDRFPIMDILAQTPPLHPSCQWALFLRNHDELTLEMVTDDERDYMYRAYAHEAPMRINLGIRRRLAPLVGNDRRMIELLHGLLFSLPGTPVLYYGDEIGMGDNVFLGDRNGVRTPMQWSPDRNAGFSRANPQRLFLPVIVNPEYHYEAINVETQQGNASSLLWWTKRLVALRQRFQAFGRGSIEFLQPANHGVLAFVREHGDETLLVVANLSRVPQYVELDLSRWQGRRPVELFGNTEYPAVGALPYLLTLGAHAFHWFELPARPADVARTPEAAWVPPLIHCADLASLVTGSERLLLEETLRDYLETRRWFEGRGRAVAGVRVVESVPVGALHLAMVTVRYAEGSPETYALALTPMDDAHRPPGTGAVVARLHATAPDGVTAESLLVDALEEGDGAGPLVDAVLAGLRTRGREGEFVAATTEDAGVHEAPGQPMLWGTREPGAPIRFDDRYLMRCFRRVDPTPRPEAEMLRFLGAHHPGLAPALVGTFEWRRGRSERVTLATVERYVPHSGTAWQLAREELGRFYERVLSTYRQSAPPALTVRSPALLAELKPPDPVAEAIGAYRDTAALLGLRTAEMHLALAGDSGDPAFAPDTYSVLDQRSKYQSLRNLIGRALRMLRERMSHFAPRELALARILVQSEPRILRSLEPFLAQRLPAQRLRGHGDYDLAHVLVTGKDIVVVGFEGGRTRSTAGRRRKRSPLRDVAGLLHSFHLAAFTALMDDAVVRETDRRTALPWADQWQCWVSAAFLRSYLEATRDAAFVPGNPGQLGVLLDTFVLEKAFYDLQIELERGGDRVGVTVYGLVHLLEPDGLFPP